MATSAEPELVKGTVLRRPGSGSVWTIVHISASPHPRASHRIRSVGGAYLWIPADELATWEMVRHG